MDNDTLISKAARLGDTPLEWNEIDFVGWPAFRRMAPAVIGLEIGRIERLISNHEIGSESYNTLIRLRYTVRRFIDELEEADENDAPQLARLLEQALLTLSATLDPAAAGDAETLRYVAHRLTYIHNRLNLIYTP